MTIYIRNRKNEFIRSSDNNHYTLIFHLWLARQRWWQLLITPKHVILGIYYGYSVEEIAKFVRRHVKEQLTNQKSQ